MTNKEKTVKIFFVVIFIFIVSLPNIIIYYCVKEINSLNEKIYAFNLIESVPDFTDDYDYGDLDYGSCGVALSGSFENMVIDWREDPVYRPEDKTAYLTFDDGPSSLTPEILDILDDYNIKATFFVIGNKNEEDKKFYKEIIKRGHTLGLHSKSHKYSYIYESLDNFLEDFDSLFTEIEDLTGEKSVLFRFPGGSTNGEMIKNNTFDAIQEEMDSRGFIYYDWNVSGEDAVYKYISPENITNNVLGGAKNKNFAIVLLHDTSAKTSTVKALPKIIEGLQNQGFKLDKLTPSLKPIQFQ